MTVTATDLFGDSTSVDYHLVVDNVDDVPTVTMIEDLSTSENAAPSNNISSHLNDGDDHFSLDTGEINDRSISDDVPEKNSSHGADGDSPDSGTYMLDLSSGKATLNGDQFDLSADAAGTLTFEDGRSVSFDGVETISWADKFGYDAETVALADGGGLDIAGERSEDVPAGDNGADTTSGELLDDYFFGDIGDDPLSDDESADALVENQSADMFVVHEGKRRDKIRGSSSRTEVIQVLGSSGSDAPAEAWTVNVDGGDTQTITSDQGFLNLGSDRSGTITFNDGTEITFQGIKRIEW